MRVRIIVVLYGVLSLCSGSELGSLINVVCILSLFVVFFRVMCCVFGLFMFFKILVGDFCR